jgi:hypothetical protein
VANISDCVNEAIEALKHFGENEVKDYVHDVLNRAREIDPSQGGIAIDQATKEINDAMAKELFTDAAQTARNVMYFEKNVADINSGKADLRNLLAGREVRDKYFRQTDKDSRYRGNSVVDAVHFAGEELWGRLLSDLSHEEFEHLSGGDFDGDIAAVVDGKKTENPLTKKAADTIKSYMEYRDSMMILSGAMKESERHARRYFRQVHDQSKIIAGGQSWIKRAMDFKKVKIDTKSWWKERMLKRIDVRETFKRHQAIDLKTGDIDDAKVNEQLDKSYENIVTGKSNIFTKSEVVNDREAVKRKGHIFYIWKTLNDQVEYNKECGSGNLFAMISRDVSASSQAVGVARKWGDNPAAMYLDLKKAQGEVRPENSTWWHYTDLYYKSVMRLDQDNISPTASTFFANTRIVTSMAKLPLVVPRSLSDIGTAASFAKRYGASGWGRFADGIVHIFNAVPTENRQTVARLFRSQIDTELAHIGRWADDASISGVFNKISARYFKVNMLSAFDRGNKIGAMSAVGEQMYKVSGSSWKTLPEATRTYLERFIDEKEWDLLRDKNNGKFFSTENVDNISNAELREHYQSTDKSLPLSEVRTDLATRVYAMFTVASEQSVLNPGHFEKVFAHQGTGQGTGIGILAREVAQFKMFALSTLDRTIIDGLRNADGVQQKLIWGLQLMAMTAPLVYAGDVITNAALGKAPPSPSNSKTFWRDMLVSPLSIFYRYMGANTRDAQDLLGGVVGSPSMLMIASAIMAAKYAATGDGKNAKKQAKKVAENLLPLQTTPGVTPILNNMFGS